MEFLIHMKLNYKFEVESMNVKIKKLSQQKYTNVCLFSREVFNSLNLLENVKYNIHLGQSAEYCSIDLYDGEGNVMAIPEKLFDELLIFQGMRLNIRKEDEDIYLGPVVGIFINYHNLPFFKKGTALKYNARAALFENCLSYYFSIDDIDWSGGKIKGYTLVPKSEEWVVGWFPIPDIIYDRGIKFKEEEKSAVKEIRKRFRKHPKIKIINRRNYLGKKDTFEKLSRFPEVSIFLPRTITYTNFNDLIMMLKQYNFLFIKSSLGSRGQEVLSIEMEGEKYNLIFYSKGLNKIILNDIEELRNYVEEYTKEKVFIIQEGIRLLKYKGSVFDMRVIIIKNSEGKWRAIENWGRIAQSNYTITNHCAGGSLELYENMYPNLSSSLSTEKIPNKSEIEMAAIKIAENIEKAFGSFGVLGLDLGIDMYGKLWFIEANTIPDNFFAEGDDYLDGIPPQNLAIFEYVKYLAGFND
jgi:hypothetical protein